MSEEPVRRDAETQPTSALLLAHALDACVDAERAVPGSAEEIIASQPAWARAELRRMLNLACSLDVAASNAVMSPDFREAARARLLKRIAGDARPSATPTPISSMRVIAMPSPNGYHHLPSHERGLGRPRRGLWRGSAGLLAAVLMAAATLTASASALPGEPLYSVKQAKEEIGVRLASDDQTRTQLLLSQADARLDETARLLQLGRAADAARAAQRYDQTLQRATTGYSVTTSIDAATDDTLDTRLSKQEEHLQSLIASAPEPAQADLREALTANERSRALVADPPSERPQAGRPRAALAAAVPTSAPTVAPTPVPTSLPTPAPLQVALVAPTATPMQGRHDDDRKPDAAPPLIARAADRQDREDRQARAAQAGRHDDADDAHGDGAADRAQRGPDQAHGNDAGDGGLIAQTLATGRGHAEGQGQGQGSGPAPQRSLVAVQDAGDHQGANRHDDDGADTPPQPPVPGRGPSTAAIARSASSDNGTGDGNGGGRGRDASPPPPAVPAIAPPVARLSPPQPTATPVRVQPAPTSARPAQPPQQHEQAQPPQQHQAQPQTQQADNRGNGNGKPETPAQKSSSGSSAGNANGGNGNGGGNADGGAKSSGRGH
jgi:hypothetical protein